MGLIRFLLACGVILGHSSPIFGYRPLCGDLAVQCFYIMSGFYMAMVLNEKYTGPRSNFLFYTNRALKIYPLYWANLFILIAWSLFTFMLGYPSTLRFYAWAWPLPAITFIYFLVMNLFIFGADDVFLLGIQKNGSLNFSNHYTKGIPSVYLYSFNGVAWTIGVELLFYLIAPFITRKTIWLAVAILICSLGLRVALAHAFYDGPPWSYMFFPTQLSFFMGGIISYRLYKKLPSFKLNKKILYGMYGILLITVLTDNAFYINNYPRLIMLFLAFILFIPASFIVTNQSKLDRVLGNLSYSIYISQIIVLRFLAIKRFPKVISPGFTALVMVIALAVLLDWLISRPIEKYRQQRVSKLALAKGSI